MSTPPADAPQALSPDVQALIAPVHDAIEAALAAQAKLPAPADDHEALRRLGDLDKTAWGALSHVDFANIPPDQKPQAKAQIGVWIQFVDQSNADGLIKILPPEGWFAISRYGADGEDAAYRIVLHADIDTWRRFMPVVARFAAIGEAKGEHYAFLSDRLAVHEGRPQNFGSQVNCVDGVYKPYPIVEPEALDERRLSLHMPPYATFLKTLEGRRC